MNQALLLQLVGQKEVEIYDLKIQVYKLSQELLKLKEENENANKDDTN